MFVSALFIVRESLPLQRANFDSHFEGWLLLAYGDQWRLDEAEWVWHGITDMTEIPIQ